MISSTDKKPLQSKKWIAMVLGVLCSIIVFLASLATIIIKGADIAQHVVSLANTVVVFLGMTVSILVTGQSAVDWRHTSSLSAATSDEIKTFVKKIEIDIKQKNETIDKYRDKYKDDESYKPIDSEEEMWK